MSSVGANELASSITISDRKLHAGMVHLDRGGRSNSALVRLGRGHKFFSISIAAILRSVILCNYDA